MGFPQYRVFKGFTSNVRLPYFNFRPFGGADKLILSCKSIGYHDFCLLGIHIVKHPRMKRMRNGIKTGQMGQFMKSTRPGLQATRSCLMDQLEHGLTTIHTAVPP
ncbi:hypothetical protein EPI10_000354 [Gossypium australe]|uniref:Uncharacterized protein n=1 Tax=Gossypium australe TaxID=47621 RepID=A0A5B6V7Y4_9ROSI|nr:hypothetical protein EPI10_000354 [Gossypium australe]